MQKEVLVSIVVFICFDGRAVPPKLSDRSDIIVMTDEAHRSQYDTLALNMRNALPNAAFIGFTGTPLMAGEEKTKEVFGEYVSVYNFQQSIEDGATVPLFYENRIPELQLANENFKEELEALVEAAELDDEQEKKLEREFAREYHPRHRSPTYFTHPTISPIAIPHDSLDVQQPHQRVSDTALTSPQQRSSFPRHLPIVAGVPAPQRHTRSSCSTS